MRSVEDLRSASVGALAGSATIPALKRRRVEPEPFGTIAEGLAALNGGELDAFVHDAAILHYRASSDFPGRIRLLEAQFDIGAYGIALPPGSELREPINREILRITRDPEWAETVRGYLGGGG